MPGIRVIDQQASRRRVQEDLEIIVGAGTMDDWRDQIIFLPF